MATIELVKATPRTGKFNKNAARRVRVAGRIPAVVYGAGAESIAIEVEPKQILKILHSESGHNTIFDFALEGAAPAKVMIVDWQYEPIKGSLLHIDLKRIAMDKTMRVSVPVQLLGVAPGVKNQGGVLEHVLREIDVECLPTDIPSHIDVDISGLDLHGVIRVSDLPHAGKLKFLDSEDATVVHVVNVKAEAEAEPAAATAAEPEVAKKGKQETADAAPAKK